MDITKKSEGNAIIKFLNKDSIIKSSKHPMEANPSTCWDVIIFEHAHALTHTHTYTYTRAHTHTRACTQAQNLFIIFFNKIA